MAKPPRVALPRATGRTFRRLATFVFAFLAISMLATSGYLFRDDIKSTTMLYLSGESADYFEIPFDNDGADDGDHHPIDWLIHEARNAHARLLQHRSTNLATAAKRYRERRGRHPPPGFGEWFHHAEQKDAIVIENFFDRIYDDLRPFWGVEAATVAARADGADNVIRIRDGIATADLSANTGGVGAGRGKNSRKEKGHGPTVWLELIMEMAIHLPDMDVPVNDRNEPRVLAPWESVAELVEKEASSRAMPDKDEVKGEFRTLNDDSSSSDKASSKVPATTWLGWEDDEEGGHPKHLPLSWYWDLIRTGCAPGSASRDAATEDTDFKNPPALPYKWDAPFTHKGSVYVRNASGAADPCAQPHLRSLHTGFVEPGARAADTTTDLVPLFGGGKPRPHNDVLLPAPAYLEDRDASNVHRLAVLLGPEWPLKDDRLLFQGVGSGGARADSPWRHFHRARLVEMLNGTWVQRIEAGGKKRANTFNFPPKEAYDTQRRRNRELGTFLSEFATAGFSLFSCPEESSEEEEEEGKEKKSDKSDKDKRGNKKTKEAETNKPSHTPCANMAGELSALDRGGAGLAFSVEDYNAKFFPVVDHESRSTSSSGDSSASGTGVSSRFRHVLLSTSVPLKATVWAEWHDDRLVPWLHYVPLDNTFRDLYAIIDYFTDGDDSEGYLGKVGMGNIGRSRKGDKAARWIAESGRSWATQVLRRDDMRLYVWRLLLEWARVCDGERERLGFVDDMRK